VKTITEIPRSEEFIEGIINFRGEIVTVIDFQKKLNMPITNQQEKEIIIVVELHSDEKTALIGLLADQVRKVFSMNNSELKPVPEFGNYYNPEFLTGVAKPTMVL
jgi:purine-binding chemotaxis protein CheW